MKTEHIVNKKVKLKIENDKAKLLLFFIILTYNRDHSIAP